MLSLHPVTAYFPNYEFDKRYLLIHSLLLIVLCQFFNSPFYLDKSCLQRNFDGEGGARCYKLAGNAPMPPSVRAFIPYVIHN